MKKHSSSTKKYYPALIGAALLAASLFQFSRPVFSAGTEAGTTIRNTATGSYEDDAGKEYTTESNTVDVTVARVAGITNQPVAIRNETNPSGRIRTGNRASFTFEITNVGNDISDIFIPGLGNITTTGLSRATEGEQANNLVIQVSPALDADDNLVTIDADGNPVSGNAFPGFDELDGNADDLRGNNTTDGKVTNVPANGKVLVKVTGTVTATGQNSRIQVRLGNTGDNDEENNPLPPTQNQPDVNDNDTAGGEPDDVRTDGQTFDTGNGTVSGGEKEASALQGTVLGANPLAMVYIGKVRGERELNDATLQDDVIPYSLKLEVRSETESPIFTAGDLEGRDFSSSNASTGTIAGPGITTGVDGDANGNQNLILVSDAIPQFTNLASIPSNVPTNWTPVYTYDELGVGDNPTLPRTATWNSTPPVENTNPDGSDDTAVTNELRDVTAIGWVYDARPTPDGNGPIARGTTNIDPFTFEVVTAGLPEQGGIIANIAQAFGTTDDGTPAENEPETTGGAPVFDESGDRDSSNFTGEERGPGEGNDLSTGIADPGTHGEDEDNNNTGDPASPGGEDNVLDIGQPGQLLNGLRGNANATGNIFDEGPNNQHDFQNLGVNQGEDADGNPVTVTAKPGETLNPVPITFENTFAYPSGSTEDLTNVKLQPIRPNFGDIGGQNNLIPVGTIVRLIYNGNTATYEYIAPPEGETGNRFDFVGDPDDSVIEFPTLAPGSSIDYLVEIDLPPNTDFSTNIDRGFPIPIVAFTDSDATQDGVPDLDGDGNITNGNVTVNQIYTGFIKLVKQVRVLDPVDGQPRDGMDFQDPNTETTGTGDNEVTTILKQPRPGDILEYRVIYRNISEPLVQNSNSVILNGVDINIDENGTSGSPNNWALDNDENNTMDTMHVSAEGTAPPNQDSAITYYTGNSTNKTVDGLSLLGPNAPANTDITGYRYTVENVPPAGTENLATPQTGLTLPDGNFAFTFQRKVEGFELPQTQTQTQVQVQR